MRLSSKIPLNITTTPATYGTILDISQFISFSVYSDNTAFAGSYIMALYMDLGDAAGNNFQAGTSSLTGPSQQQNFNLASGGFGNFAGLRLYCNGYTSGTPTFWLVGRYAY